MMACIVLQVKKEAETSKTLLKSTLDIFIAHNQMRVLCSHLRPVLVCTTYCFCRSFIHIIWKVSCDTLPEFTLKLRVTRTSRTAFWKTCSNPMVDQKALLVRPKSSGRNSSSKFWGTSIRSECHQVHTSYPDWVSFNSFRNRLRSSTTSSSISLRLFQKRSNFWPKQLILFRSLPWMFNLSL